MPQRYPDGSVRYRKPLPVVLENWTQDPNDPCLYRPNFLPCTRRFVPHKKTPCGKIQLGGFTCNINNEIVTPRICVACTVRVPP
jgi:hypothetical protein